MSSLNVYEIHLRRLETCVLGNEILYDLLWSGNYRLRVVIRDWNGTTAYAEYSTFFITSSFDNYRLSVGEYSGTAGNLS